ncbi:MAG: TraB/VirB10 family protein [Pseudomonadota bacterium]
MLQALLRRIFSDPKGVAGQQIRYRQLLRLSLIIGIGVIILCAALSMQGRRLEPAGQVQSPVRQQISLASDSVDMRDLWSHRLMEKAEAKNEEFESLLLENNVMKKRLDALEALAVGGLKNAEARGFNPASSSLPESDSPNSLSGVSGGGISGVTATPMAGDFSKVGAGKSLAKMAFVSVETDNHFKFHSSQYVVAGTYAKAALLSGVVVSTAVASQSNPQPVALRLIDSGNLPRGWSSRIKDAVLVGSCYGDLSSERAMCRINTLAFVEENGMGVEITVEGWIFGEDGASGVRGKVVDRAGEVARESLFAGILGGMSSFLKNQATSSVFPVTPFGQTNALKTSDVLKGSLGNGAGNALEKLAEFSIKRAEAMQPVIVVRKLGKITFTNRPCCSA